MLTRLFFRLALGRGGMSGGVRRLCVRLSFRRPLGRCRLGFLLGSRLRRRSLRGLMLSRGGRLGLMRRGLGFLLGSRPRRCLLLGRGLTAFCGGALRRFIGLGLMRSGLVLMRQSRLATRLGFRRPLGCCGLGFLLGSRLSRRSRRSLLLGRGLATFCGGALRRFIGLGLMRRGLLLVRLGRRLTACGSLGLSLGLGLCNGLIVLLQRLLMMSGHHGRSAHTGAHSGCADARTGVYAWLATLPTALGRGAWQALTMVLRHDAGVGGGLLSARERRRIVYSLGEARGFCGADVTLGGPMGLVILVRLAVSGPRRVLLLSRVPARLVGINRLTLVVPAVLRDREVLLFA
jgi:hypothetical protein